tara:strand:- start:295 stop:600 length:306 start_codon:yes stop_codon:yes gene_type:complete
MKLIPINDKIVVKPKEKPNETKTDSGIILPDVVEGGTLLEGEVIAASSGAYSMTGELIPTTVKTGDVILYSSHAVVQEHKLNGEDIVIMSQNEVLSIVEDV